MNAPHEHVIRWDKAPLPLAHAFWSVTLCDLNVGVFIPNDRKKYSVGERAGMKLNDKGGIDVTVKKPEGVRKEDGPPIQRSDEAPSVTLRVDVPDHLQMKSWKVPLAEVLRP